MDDLGWRDLGVYGSSFYETPNLDRLAAQGICFSDAYAACPVCSPTRASILTGKYPATLGLTDWIDWTGRVHPARGKLIDVPYVDHLPLEETTVAEVLRAAGYHTWHVGKWHLGGPAYRPEKQGFERNVAGCDWGSPRHGYFAPWGMPNLEEGPEGEYLTDRLTDEAIRLIESNDDGRPFFLNLCYYSVHTPIQAKAEKIAKYEAKAKALGLDQLQALEEGAPFPCEHKKDRRIVRRLFQSDPVYAAMVESVDENVGRLLQALDESGQAENTLVVFFSDNGGLATSEGSPTCNAPLAEGKGWTYEGGTREPLIVRWPATVEAGAWCQTPVTSTDLYPTILEAAGLPLMPEQHVDGVSLLPLLTGSGPLAREAIYWHYPHYGNQGGTPGSSIRVDDHKLIEFFEDGRLELYNLRQDVGEAHNLVDAIPTLAHDLAARLAAWRERVEAKIPQPNPKYVPWG
jgi:arylsulfatase A-like enzyme